MINKIIFFNRLNRVLVYVSTFLGGNMGILKLIAMLANCLLICGAKRALEKEIDRNGRIGSWAMIVICFLNLVCIAI